MTLKILSAVLVATAALAPSAAEAKQGCVTVHEAYHTKTGARLVHVQRRIEAHPFRTHRTPHRQVRYYEMCRDLGESFFVRYELVDRRWRVEMAGFSSAMP